MVVGSTIALVLLAVLGGAFLWYAATVPSSRVFGSPLVQGPAHSNYIALTFDDGPSVPYTGQILDLLGERSVKATFFVCGQNVELHPELARRIVAEGHSIGNHTYSHPFLYLLGPRAMSEEIDRTQSIIEKATAVRPKLFRPPYGIRWFGLTRILRERGLALVQWSATGYDWKNRREEIIAAALAGLQPGAILLLHDIHAETVAALPKILEGVKAAGLEPVELSKLAVRE